MMIWRRQGWEASILSLAQMNQQQQQHQQQQRIQEPPLVSSMLVDKIEERFLCHSWHD